MEFVHLGTDFPLGQALQKSNGVILQSISPTSLLMWGKQTSWAHVPLIQVAVNKQKPLDGF